MDENLLETKDLSLTLSRPTYGDEKTYICRVYNRKGVVLMMKQVQLKVKVHQVEVKSGVKSVLLSCRTTESLDGDVRVEWRDSRGRKVHVYQNGSDQPEEQDEFYRTRTKMDENLLENKDLSLTLRWPTYEDEKTYICSVYSRKGDVLMEKRVWLKVIVQEQVEVKLGVESVLLPCRTTESLDGDVRVEWRDKENRKVHVYQNGSDLPDEQDEFYRTRTKMDGNLLKTKDLSLTLSWPTFEDMNLYICRVYNRDGVLLIMKEVCLWVKVHQVEVEPGVESVLLSCRTTESLDGDVRVVWTDKYDRTVHVYQNGSDQPGEQNQIYRTRTKMDENLQENKDLSLTLTCPTYEDRGIFTCRVSSKDGDVQMEKKVALQVKDPEVEVEPGVKSVLLSCRTRESLDGDVRVVWMDRWNRKVHVYQNGSDQPREKNQFYRTRTRMDGNLLKTKDLSLTLSRPTEGDGGKYTCRVYNRDGVVLMMKQVQLKVKAQEQVEVEPGVESVLLPWRTTEDLDGDVRVEWMDDRDNRKVHVYQNGSDQPEEQDQFYRTRTKMDGNLLKTKDLSLTLRRPTYEDMDLYTCTVYRNGVVLMMKQVYLRVKAGTDQDQPEDTRMSLLADQSV